MNKQTKEKLKVQIVTGVVMIVGFLFVMVFIKNIFF